MIYVFGFCSMLYMHYWIKHSQCIFQQQLSSNSRVLRSNSQGSKEPLTSNCFSSLKSCPIPQKKKCLELGRDLMWPHRQSGLTEYVWRKVNACQAISLRINHTEPPQAGSSLISFGPSLLSTPSTLALGERMPDSVCSGKSGLFVRLIPNKLLLQDFLQFF